MIYEVRLEIFGQVLSMTVKADDVKHLYQRLREEIKITGIREVKDPLAQLAAELDINNLVR